MYSTCAPCDALSSLRPGHGSDLMIDILLVSKAREARVSWHIKRVERHWVTYPGSFTCLNLLRSGGEVTYERHDAQTCT